jgi:hypothetical protein
MELAQLAVQIVRFVDPHQPGFVECEFTDVEGRRHTIMDKVPIFTDGDLDAQSACPLPGAAPCEVLSSWKDERGRDLVRVTLARPAEIQSAEGLLEFTVLATQLKPEL